MELEKNTASEKPILRQRDASELAAGYLTGFRKIEIASIVAFLTMSAMIWSRLYYFPEKSLPLLVAAFFAGWVMADFVSGFVHWAADTWGNADWPIVGKTLIRTFREHHVDQKAITRHDFVETNGSNCMVSLPVLVLALLLPMEEGDDLMFFTVAFILSLTLWVFATNQIHKWAHQDKPLRLVQWFQKSRLILGPKHHSIHHTPPYSKYYCITTGWLNLPLNSIGFFRTLEAAITRLTGAIPRKDDIGEEAARHSTTH